MVLEQALGSMAMVAELVSSVTVAALSQAELALEAMVTLAEAPPRSRSNYQAHGLGENQEAPRDIGSLAKIE
ncbi:hypothetical protein V6N11_072500 [Hibiscus sabdariffa]|uniref:VAN3-binding protein-like auxin canalisation domain-containing protein n=1 Tax=Hibiscus sabdariffa TaxID=183260 RepID=A0ABR2U3J8_9ROSI